MVAYQWVGFVFATPFLAAGLAAQEPQETIVADRAGSFPHQKHEPLPAKAIGILVAEPGKLLANEGRSGPPDHICFARGKVSYRWVYMVTEAPNPQISNLQVPTGLKGEVVQVYPSLAMANSEIAKSFGIVGKYVLVEAEVNQGLGSPAVDAFVATKLKVVEGTREYPFKTAEVVARIQQVHAGWLAGQMPAAQRAVDGLALKIVPGGKLPGPSEKAELMSVSWLPDTERIRIQFRTKLSDGDYRMIGAGGAAPIPGGPPRPAPPLIKAGTTFGAEFGRCYEVSKTGAIVAFEVMPLETFVNVLPLPPAVRPRAVGPN